MLALPDAGRKERGAWIGGGGAEVQRPEAGNRDWLAVLGEQEMGMVAIRIEGEAAYGKFLRGLNFFERIMNENNVLLKYRRNEDPKIVASPLRE